MTTRATKEACFEASHMLTGHKGDCKNLHGHSYKVQVTFESDEFNSLGMVADFSNIKKALKNVIDKMDHAYIFNVNVGIDTMEGGIAEMLMAQQYKVYPLKGTATAEYMARHILNVIGSVEGAKVYSVKLWETATSFAEVFNG